ncbi:MAG: S8 family serine peptidase [Oscillospiraceae bacterium]|jgi:RHS repeat-associated protein|nr:S8 family serine peptidase [Oscillospiraceae bacterium]
MKKMVKIIASIMAVILLLQPAALAISEAGDVNSQPAEKARFIIKYTSAENKNQVENNIKSQSLKKPRVKKSFEQGMVEVIEVDPEQKAEYLSFYQNEESNIEYAVEDDKLNIFYDSALNIDAHLQAKPQSDAAAAENNIAELLKTSLEESRQYSTGGNSVVGVLDTGININHPALKDNIYINLNERRDLRDNDDNGYTDDINGWDFYSKNNSVYDAGDGESHGTAIAGIIVETAPQAAILPLKFIKNGSGYTSDAIEAIEYAKSLGVKIINCSWGTSQYNYALKDAMENSGMVFICASGNGGDEDVVYPAAYALPNIISIGGLNADGQLYVNTSSNNGNDLYAPAQNVKSCNASGGYSDFSGTSFAAPYVSGIAALCASLLSDIDSFMLSRAVKDGYQLNNGLKIADANKAVLNSKALRYLQDAAPRLVTVIKSIGKTPDWVIVDILLNHNRYGSLSSGEKEIAANFFGFSKEAFEFWDTKQVGLIDSVIVISASQNAGLSNEQIYGLYVYYNDIAVFEQQMSALGDILSNVTLSEQTVNGICDALMNGWTVSQLARPLAVAEVTGIAFAELAVTGDCAIDYSAPYISFDSAEKSVLRSIALNYRVRLEELFHYLDENAILPSAFEQQLIDWQVENNFFFGESKVNALSDSTVNKMAYNKYKMPGQSDHMNEVSVSQLEGSITYSKELLSLAGKDNLDLTLGVRYDQDDAYQSGNLKDVDDLTLVYQVHYITTEYVFSKIDGTIVEVNENIDYLYQSPVYSEPSLHNYYLNIDHFDDDRWTYYYYYYIVTDAWIGSAHPENPSAQSIVNGSYNDDRYDLGKGWAYSFPSIEIRTSKYIIHFPDGQKYNLKNESSYYSPEGYSFQDIKVYSVSGSEFSSGSRSSQWKAVYKTGKCDYFDSTGAYIGSANREAATADSFIRVFYNGNNTVSYILDSVGRKITFTYTTLGDYNKSVDISVVDTGEVNGQRLVMLYLCKDFFFDDFNISEIIYFNSDNDMIKNISYTYSIPDFSACVIGYNAYSVCGFVSGYSDYYTTVVTTPLTAIYEQTLVEFPNGDLGYRQTSSMTSIDYEWTGKRISEACYRGYCRVKSIVNTVDTDDHNGGYTTISRNEKQYRYLIENINTGVISSLEWPLHMGAWDVGVNKYWPREDQNQYRLEIIEGNKKTRYKYNNDRLNTNIEIYETQNNWFSQTLYSTSQITYGDRIPVKEVTRRNGSGTQLCNISDYQYDVYGNLTEKKVQAGYSTNNGTPTITATVEHVKSTYGTNKAIPAKVETGIYKSDSSNDYYLVTENYFDPLNEKVISSVNYSINAANPSVKNYLNKADNIYSGGQLMIASEIDLQGYPNSTKASKSTHYTYDSKYGIYPASVMVPNAIINEDGTKTAVTDTFVYDIFGRMVEESKGSPANKYEYTYDMLGNVTGVIQPDGGSSSLDIDYFENVVVSTDCDGSKVKNTYDMWGNLEYEYRYNQTSQQYELIRKYTYDDRNRVLRMYEYANVAQTQYIYVQYEYDFLDRVISSAVYDQNNQLLSKKTNTYSITTYQGTACEKLIETTYKGASAYSRLVKYTDAAGNMFAVQTEYQPNMYYLDQYQFSDYGKALTCAGDLIDTVTYVYDVFGRVVETKNALNKSTRVELDGFGRVLTNYDEENNDTVYAYDALDRAYHVKTLFDVDPISGAHQYAEKWTYYDVYGNVIESRQDNHKPGETASQSIARYSYDVMQNLTMTERVIDASNSLYTQYCYNSAGSLLKTFNGLKVPLTITDKDTYITNGDTIFSTVEYVYDQYQNVTAYIDSLGNPETYQYDFKNRLTSTITRKNQTIQTTYDALGRKTSISGGGITQQMVYDELGRVTLASDANGSYEYTYDLLGRVQSETTTTNVPYVINSDFLKTYIYNPKNIQQITVSEWIDIGQSFWINRKIEQRTYDALGRISGIEIQENEWDIDPLLVSYTYGDNSSLIESNLERNNNAVKNLYTYNSAGIVTGITKQSKTGAGAYTTDFIEAYQYKLDGNLYNKSDNVGNQTDYTYDALNRLTGEAFKTGQTEKWSTSYVLDDFDNQKTKSYQDHVTGQTVQTSYTYNAAQHVLTQSEVDSVNGSQSFAYSYDSNGNLLSKTRDKDNVQTVTQSHQYDAFDRLVSTDTLNGNATVTTAYTYDVYNRRIAKRVGYNTIRHVWDGDSIIIDAGEINNQSYYYGIGGVIATADNSNTSAYIKNGHGDVVGMHGLVGNGSQTFAYDAYGNETTAAGSNNPFRYSGEYFDASTGLYYLRARYYDPQIGRFTQEDPARDGINWYAYCAGDPVNYWDPSGLFSVTGLFKKAASAVTSAVKTVTSAVTSAAKTVVSAVTTAAKAVATAAKSVDWGAIGAGAAIGVGAALCATGVGGALGVSLIVAGSSTLLSKGLDAAGVDSKIASQISAGLNIIAGTALCFTGVGAGIGASMIGSGIGSFAGGYISEGLGGSYELGAGIGSFVGGIAGGQVYKGIQAAGATRAASSATSMLKSTTPSKQVGNYLLRDAQGQVRYTGVGGQTRMAASVSQRSKEFGAALTPEFRVAPDRTMALAREAMYINRYGGPQSMATVQLPTKLLNKINSPGLKTLIDWF